MKPSAEQVRELLDYDPQTGVFRWRHQRSRYRAGAVAGTITPERYRRIGLGGRRTYAAHRLAWLYVHGEWPGDLDHKDNDRGNNAISNLRLATDTQNAANRKRRCDSSSGYKGVCWHKGTRRWVARINENGKRKSLGYFPNPEMAHAAYVQAATEVFGEFARCF